MEVYATKDHRATLLVLIKEFYKKELNEEEIELIGNTTLEKEEVLYYGEAKTKRHSASYGLSEGIFTLKNGSQ